MRTNDPLSSVKHKAIRSAKWSGLSEVFTGALNPLVIIILARILTPHDFGIVAIATIFVGAAEHFSELGLGRLLIQIDKKELDFGKIANSVFWFNLVMSILMCLAVFMLARPIAAFFNSPESINVIRLLACLLVIHSFLVVQRGAIQRSFGFKETFMGSSLFVLFYACVSIPLASGGFGPWSLVWGTLAGTFVQSMFLWHKSDWRPSLDYDLPFLFSLIRHSKWFFIEGLLKWTVLSGGAIALGHFLSVMDMGIFRAGDTIAKMLFLVLVSPIIPILFPMFSRLQSEKEELGRVFDRTFKVLLFLVIPSGILLSMCSNHVSAIILGSKWYGAGSVLSFMAVFYALNSITDMGPELYRALGRSKSSSILLLTQLAAFLPVYLFAAPLGFNFFCAAFILVYMIPFSLNIFYLCKTLDKSVAQLLSLARTPMIAAFAAAIPLFFILNILPKNRLVEAVFGVPVFAGVYLLIVYFIDKAFIAEFFQYITLALAKKGPPPE
jgi:PST family polysaccharide transporter